MYQFLSSRIYYTSEHLELGGHSLENFPMDMLNHFTQSKEVSIVLKEGTVTPNYKKGDTTNPGNYPGITVTPEIISVQEHIVNQA